MAETVIIPRRFRGPPQSGNGGYSCGVVGTLLGGTAEVTLRSPPALDRALAVERSAGGVRVSDGDTLVAEAKPSSVILEAPPAPSFEEALDATTRFAWREKHAYPMCFVCGPDRGPGDGLCIFPGAVAGRDIAAAPCPSWFGFACFDDFDDPKILLGRLTARVDARPRAGDRCLAIGWLRGREGRKILCGSALYAEGGALLAVAHATWIASK